MPEIALSLILRREWQSAHFAQYEDIYDATCNGGLSTNGGFVKTKRLKVAKFLELPWKCRNREGGHELLARR